MFEYEQETYGSKGRERIRAAAMAHTGKKGKVLLPPTRRQKAEGLDKVEVDVCFESASSNSWFVRRCRHVGTSSIASP